MMFSSRTRSILLSGTHYRLSWVSLFLNMGLNITDNWKLNIKQYFHLNTGYVTMFSWSFDNILWYSKQVTLANLVEDYPKALFFNRYDTIQANKGKKQKVPHKNNYRHRQRQWHSASGKCTRPSRNPAT